MDFNDLLKELGKLLDADDVRKGFFDHQSDEIKEKMCDGSPAYFETLVSHGRCDNPECQLVDGTVTMVLDRSGQKPGESDQRWSARRAAQRSVILFGISEHGYKREHVALTQTHARLLAKQLMEAADVLESHLGGEQ
jgi:hypothetical protein